LAQLVSGKRILAPLVGGSDLSFRLLARHYGAQVTFTEMCIAEYYYNKEDPSKKVKRYVFQFDPKDRPLILQLAGNTAKPIIDLVNTGMFDGHIDGVDLNCGCPQGFAMQKGIGAGILRDADNLVSMAEEITKNIKYPLSVKLRIHQDVPTTISIVKRLQKAGVQAFTVHGREWWQKGEKRGENNWDAIRQIKEAFPDIPIIGNGDVSCYDDFERFQKLSGCDSIMSGYGALRYPSIFSPTRQTTAIHVKDYLDIARCFTNKWVDVLRHIMWIVKHHITDPNIKAEIFQTESLNQLLDILSTKLKMEVLLNELPTGQKDMIEYPKQESEMTEKERKQHLKRKRKVAQQTSKKKFKKAGDQPTGESGPDDMKLEEKS